MAIDAIRCLVRAGQREVRRVVVKIIIGATGWVTSQASLTVIGIAVDSGVIIVCLRVGMAGNTSEFCVIRWVGMTIRASAPFAIVFAAVNREILRVVVESGGRPG